jgi:hypothetical protein
VAALTTLAGMIAFPASAHAAGGARYVSATGSDLAGGDCSDAQRPCATVQHAVNVAAAGDAVRLTVGTYREAVATRSGVPSVLSVSGGWDSAYTSQSGTSTIDATGRSSPIGSGEVLRLLDPGDEVTADRLTLTGGHGNGGAFGVVRNRLMITRSILTGNRGGSGGGIYNFGGTVSVTDSQITGNTASDNAGGVGNLGGGQLTMTRTTVSDNHVDIGRGEGGAILNVGSATIANSTLTGNSGSEGGAIRNGGPLTITDSLLSGNTASLTGGGIMAVGGGVTVVRSAITNNHAATEGGGYYAFGGVDPGHTLINTTISGNSADHGGGLWVHGGTIALSSSSVTANTANVGGGLYAEGTYSLRNALIASNSAANAPDCAHISVSADGGYNLIGNTTGCSYTPQHGDLVNIAARLGPVTGGVQTLGADSPAINAGNPAPPGSGGAACPADDQRGQSRTERCDIGAYELLDHTAPTVTGTADRAPDRAPWYRGNVTITWTATDPPPSSGAPTIPPPTTASTEGLNVVYTSAPSCEPAGNCATGQYSVSIDKTAPSIAYTISPAANSASWRNQETTVTFTCSDTLAGVASCPAPVTVTADGAGQTVTGTAVDNAGNAASVTATVNLDKTAPTITATVSQAANGNGWNNAPVTVTFICSDVGSGMASCPQPVTLTEDGADQVATGTAVDNAANTATATVSVSIDRTKPLITAVRTAGNSNGWNNGNVTVTFSCADALSRVDTCPSPANLTGEGANQSTSGTALDRAGNTATVTVAGVNIDKTAPTITATIIGAKNAAGWYNSVPTIHYTCADTLSGLATCPADRPLTSDGANQTITATAIDKAGNTTGATVININIDRTPPAVNILGAANGGTYPLNQTPAVSCSTTDTTAGVSTPAMLSTSRNATGVYTATCSGATDVAGNTAPAKTITYTVSATADTLTDLTTQYVSASGAPNANGVINDLANKLAHGQICLYITKVNDETAGPHPTLTHSQATELIY